MAQDNQTRIVTVPQPLLPANQLPANRPITVVIGVDEEVEWIWSSLPTGQQYVSGYNIVKKDELE